MAWRMVDVVDNQATSAFGVRKNAIFMGSSRDVRTSSSIARPASELDHPREGEATLAPREIRPPAGDLSARRALAAPRRGDPPHPLKYGTLARRWLNSPRKVTNSRGM
jgi:hypothetical protein